MLEFKTKEEYGKWKTGQLDSRLDISEMTANKKCPYCFTEMDGRAGRCPGCRKRIGSPNKQGIAQKYYNVGLLFCILITFLFVFGIIIAAIK